jgi:hypothetical protein
VAKKVSSSIRTVIERINWKLAAKGQILMATRRMTRQFGDYYILDLSGNVIDMDIDPEKLARKLRVLKEEEKVECRSRITDRRGEPRQ